MSHSLNHLKSINTDIKYTVFGYIRECETKLCLHTNIPIMVSYICLSYYFHGEYFDKCSNDIVISNSTNTITKKEGHNSNNSINNIVSAWCNTTYGKLWIESDIDQIAKWTLKLNHCGINTFIGLMSKDNRINSNCSTSKDKPYYAVFHAGSTDYNDNTCVYNNNMVTFKNGDIMIFILNTQKRCISIQKNNDVQFCIYENIQKNINQHIGWFVVICV
eukprot:68717_1